MERSIAEILQEQNPVHPLPATRPQRDSEVTEFKIALLSPCIAESPVEQIKQVLRLVMIKVGLRGPNWPEGIEKEVLIQHIIKNFGGNRIEEIKLAFEMAIAGELELEAKEVACYENFSCAYFSRIMTAYRKWSSQAAKAIISQDPPPNKIYTDEQNADLIRQDIEAFYQRCRAGIVPKGIPEYFEPILLKDGLLKPAEHMADFFSGRLGKGCEHIYVKDENQ